MPSVGPDFCVSLYTSASSLPSLVWETFRSYPCEANVMFPHAEKCREQERRGESSDGLWITCTTSERFTTTSLDFVLSCTRSPLGDYPVFIFTTLPSREHDCEHARRRICSIVRLLAQNVRLERVFSVFAPEQITRIFASTWADHTGVGLDRDPVYYAAKSSYCTVQSFRPRQHSVLPGVSYDLRLARDEDAARCAELCHGFAKESVR